MFRCYPAGQANDPETYTAAISAVLAEYPPEVVHRVTDPRTGVARKVKFLPSVAEVVEACEAEVKPIYEAMARQRQQKQAARDREAHEQAIASHDPALAKRMQQFVQELKGRVGTFDPHPLPGHHPPTQSDADAA